MDLPIKINKPEKTKSLSPDKPSSKRLKVDNC